MEKVACDLCGENMPIPYITTTDRYRGDEYILSRCGNCNLIYLTPRPSQDEIKYFYPDEYEAYIPPNLGCHNMGVLKAVKIQLDYVEQFNSSKGTILDIGCATGIFLNHAVERGWQVIGIEVNEQAAKMARETYGIDIFTGNIEEANISTSSIDVVTLWDVLEHLPSPRSALQEIRRILCPGGLVFFSIPNLESYDRKVFGKNWIGWDEPRHFTLFDDETITRMIKEIGFTLIEKKCILGGKGTFLLSMKRIFKEKPRLKWLEKLYPVVSFFLWPYRKFSYWKKRGPIITYAIQKI